MSDDGVEKATAEVVEEKGSATTVDTIMKHGECHNAQRSAVHRKPRHVDVQLAVVDS